MNFPIYSLVFLYCFASNFLTSKDSYCVDSRSSLGHVSTPEDCDALITRRNKDDKGFYLKCPEDGESEFACHPCETTKTLHSSCGSTSYFYHGHASSCDDVKCENGGKCEFGSCECPGGFGGPQCELSLSPDGSTARTLSVKCDPHSQQTFCRVFCGEKSCGNGVCAEGSKECECSECPDNGCDFMSCNQQGNAWKKAGKCQCFCDQGWEGENCTLQPLSPAIPSGFKGLPSHKCNEYVTIGKHEISTVEECRRLYEHQEDYSLGFFLDCYETNRGSTMKCQACTTTEVSESHCKSYTFQPVIDCQPKCLNGGVCHEDGKCLCTEDFRGDHCQDKIPGDLCADVKCEHGGACYAGRCQGCDTGYTGDKCELTDGCGDVECNEPHGACDMGSCRCTHGYLGLNCEIYADDVNAQLVNPVETKQRKHMWHIFLLAMIAVSFIGFWLWLFLKYKRDEYKAFGDYTELVTYQNYGLGSFAPAEVPLASE